MKRERARRRTRRLRQLKWFRRLEGRADTVTLTIARPGASSSQRSATAGAGSAAPLGTMVTPEGVNFSVFSKRATSIDLLLFDRVDDGKASRMIRLDPAVHRNYHYWHVFVPGLTAGQIYGFRADGPFEPQMGCRFDVTKLLLDPYGRAVMVPSTYNRS